MPTKFDVDDYNYECAHCDDVFYTEEEVKEHIAEYNHPNIWTVGLRIPL